MLLEDLEAGAVETAVVCRRMVTSSCLCIVSWFGASEAVSFRKVWISLDNHIDRKHLHLLVQIEDAMGKVKGKVPTSGNAAHPGCTWHHPQLVSPNSRDSCLLDQRNREILSCASTSFPSFLMATATLPSSAWFVLTLPLAGVGVKLNSPVPGLAGGVCMWG